MVDRLLDTYEAADYLSVSKSYLDRLRCSGGGPCFARIGRLIRYRRSALDQWVDAHGSRRHTTQPEPDPIQRRSLPRVRLTDAAASGVG